VSDKDFPPDKGAFSLKKEIHKRQTQAMQKALEEKRASKTIQPENTPFANKPLPPPAWKRATQESSAQPSTAPADPRRTQTVRTTQTAQTVQAARPIAAPKRATQSIPAVGTARPRFALGRRQSLIAIAAAGLVLLVCTGTLLIASNPQPSVTPTPIPLPAVKASDVIAYFQKAGVTISSTREIPASNPDWAASQEIQFSVQVGQEKGQFIILSYDNAERKVPDVFKASNSAKFKTWQLTTASNILLLTAPETNPALLAALQSHLTQFLVAPYRDFLPTATPKS
jgi:hypothetical protein